MSRQIYHHHELWEDWRAGLYALKYDDPITGAALAAALLADPVELYGAMSAVAREWPHAAEVNLTDEGSNKRAWLGQSACCFAHGLPGLVTRLGWHTLAATEQNEANRVADVVIAEWGEARAETLFGN